MAGPGICVWRIPAHLRCTQCSILLHLMDICFLTCICLWQISQIQTLLFKVVGPGLVSTSPAFVSSSASHPAGPKNGKSGPHRWGRGGSTQFAQQLETTVTAPPLVGCVVWSHFLHPQLSQADPYPPLFPYTTIQNVHICKRYHVNYFDPQLISYLPITQHAITLLITQHATNYIPLTLHYPRYIDPTILVPSFSSSAFLHTFGQFPLHIPLDPFQYFPCFSMCLHPAILKIGPKSTPSSSFLSITP